MGLSFWLFLTEDYKDNLAELRIAFTLELVLKVRISDQEISEPCQELLDFLRRLLKTQKKQNEIRASNQYQSK